MPYNTIITNTTNKGKVLEFEIDVGLRDEMIWFIQKRIIHNLEATKRFLELKEEDYDDICAGIYTYAVEEYGKILFLNCLSLSSSNNKKLTVPYKHYDEGFLDHKHKFPLALDGKDALPEACKMLRRDFKKGDFYEPDYVMGLSANFDARLSIFYADFNEHDNYNSVKQPTKVDRPILKEAVNEFLKFIREKKYPGC
jgi:hypothetical protein